MKKRETRLSRLERSRKKLELFCSQTRLEPRESHGFTKGNQINRIDPERILRSRTMPIRYSNLPENPFMVACVFEDLKKRWDKDNILKATKEIFHLDPIETEGQFPWAAITVMVPGEADLECARTSKLTGSAVLTNDSDFILYDLGSHGSVLFLDSVELTEWDRSRPAESKITARRLCPASLVGRLGIENIRLFAYELNQNPHLRLPELIRRSKHAYRSLELSLEYRCFNEEYDCAFGDQGKRADTMHSPQGLDPRISEIFMQYQLRDIYSLGNVAHMYFPILNEDHSRRCAWDEGRLYRTLGYSIINVSHAIPGKFEFVDEYVRRGGRIVKDRINLGPEEWIAAEMKLLCERLKSAQAAFNGNISSPCFWRLFALCDIYGLGMRNTVLLDVRRLCRFFKFGYMGQKLEWTDIHLYARIDAVLYSIRVLKQFLELDLMVEESALRVRSTVAALPPLHAMMKSRCEMTEEFPGEEVLRGFFGSLCGAYTKDFGATQALPSGQNESTRQSRGEWDDIQSSDKRISNPYEILSLE